MRPASTFSTIQLSNSRGGFCAGKSETRTQGDEAGGKAFYKGTLYQLSGLCTKMSGQCYFQGNSGDITGKVHELYALCEGL